MIKENQKYLNKILVGSDALTLLISIRVAWYFRFNLNIISKTEGNYPLDRYFIPLAVMIPVYLILYSFFKLYTPYRIKGIIKEIMNLIKANILGALLFTMMLYIFKYVDYSRYMIVTFFVVSTVFICAERCLLRAVLRALRKKGYNLKHVIFVGVNDCTFDFMMKMEANRHWGYNITGIFSDVCTEKNYSVWTKSYEEVAAVSEKSTSILGHIKDIEVYLSQHSVDEVFITLPFSHYEKLNWIIQICEKNGVKTQIIPEFSKFLSSRPYIEDIEGTAVISMRYIPLDSLINKVVKRVFDIICSFIAIIFFSPVMLFTAIIIKITSPGPILFKQERVGLNKKPFNMYKFRSMKIQKEKEEKIQWTTKDDPRKTKFGSLIRKTSIDELPQLFNVLKGDMSLVGPRPERPFFVDKFKEEIPKYMVKHQVRPGITGWAQVNGWRGDTSIEKRVECDIHYIENWSLVLDIKILFLTVFKGFINKNAY